MTDDEQQVRTLIERWAEAVHTGDIAASDRRSGAGEHFSTTVGPANWLP